MTRRQRLTAGILRGLGCLDLLALVAVLLPRSFLEDAARRLGLVLPAGPLPGYLARSASLLYALHGATVLYLSFDVARYQGLIRLLALLAVGHGLVLVGIDFVEEMPLWWLLAEGGGYALIGAAILFLQCEPDGKTAALRQN